MSTIITRSTGSSPKGAPLTAGELDANFINLNADKVESTRAINTTAGDLTGGGDLSGDRTLGLASTGISAGTVQNSATQVTPLTLDIKGRVTAVGTPVTITPDFSNVANKPTTLSGYGITDAQATITGAATTIDSEDLTASKVLISNGSGKVAASDVTTTTLGYLDATSSVQGQLDAKQATTAKNAANGYAGLDANAKLPTSLLPALAISEYLGSVANQAARLALTGEKGDWCSQANDGKVYVITGDDPTDNANWTALTYPVTPGITLNGTSIAPGDTATITAATTNTLTIGTGLSGTSFDGSAATTIAIDSSVVTLTGTQTLTNKTLTSPSISGGTVNNTAIGGTTPAAGAFTTLSSTGNTTLGDASGDTLTINGTAVSIPNNLNFDSDTLFIDAANNRVGFGTTTPSSPLSVLSAILPAALFQSTSGATAGIEIRDGAATPNRWWLMSGLGSTTDGIFSIYDARQNVSRLAISTAGNVGVGTGTPGSKLTVLSATNNGIAINDGTINTIVYNSSSGTGSIGTTTNHPLALYTNNGVRATIDIYGNVGIGTSSPITYGKLTVYGSSGVTSPNIAIVSDAFNASQGVSLDFVRDGFTQPIQARILTADNGASASFLRFQTKADGTAGALATRMTLDSSGNVGIGASSPGAKLDVQGGRSYFTANGDAYATYIRYNNSTAGVFLGSPSANSFQISGSGGGSYLNIDSSGQFMLGTTTASTYANSGKVLTVSGNAYNSGPANLYLQGNSSAPGRGFDSTEVFCLSGISSAAEITRITGTGSNGFRSYIKIIVTGHNSGIGNGTNIKEFYWDGGNAAPVQISTYTDGQVPPITFNYSTANVLIIYIASVNGVNEFKGVAKVEWLFPNDFNNNTWVIS